VALAASTVVVVVVWRWRFRASFSRFIGSRVRGRWQAWHYWRRWGAVMTIGRLAPAYQGRILLPVLGKVSATRYTDRVRVRLVSGQSAADFAARAANLLAATDSAVIASHLTALEQAAIPPGSPCHLDFHPRNWLVSESGTVSLIDFEHSRIDVPARDLVRLRFRIWPTRPDLQDAFFEGYGRHFTDAEDELTWHLGALDALTSLARGRDTHNPELTAFGLSTLRQLRDRP
jgi:hypothetical protein